ncbi:MAG: c-type cytochrome [Anaerolineae bacterium]
MKIPQWSVLTALIIIAGVLAACGGQVTPPPVAPTNTPLPPAPAEAPISTPLPAPTDTSVPSPTDTPVPAPTDTPAPAATEAAEQPPAVSAEAAKQVYVQKGCLACHGANFEGGVGPILVGLPAGHIAGIVRNGEAEAGMPAFDQNTISDEDLNTLAQFLSALTLEDIGLELPAEVADHLNQAWDALQAGDKAAVETHLGKAQESAADAPPGVQATLKDIIEDLEEVEWIEDVGAHLQVLLSK